MSTAILPSRTAALRHLSASATASSSNTTETEQTPRAFASARFSISTETDTGDASSDGYYSAVSGRASSTTASSGRRASLGRHETRPAVRIQVSTPVHRRARSDASVHDLALDSDLASESSSSIASLAGELEELCSSLPARGSLSSRASRDGTSAAAKPQRRRAKTTSLANAPTSTSFSIEDADRTAPHPTAALTPLAKPSPSVYRSRSQTVGTDDPKSARRFRASVMMQSIAEESTYKSPAQHRFSPKEWETRFSPGNPCHERWSRPASSGSPSTKSATSPAMSDLVDCDYIRFIDSDYGSSPAWTNASLSGTPISSFSHRSLSPVNVKKPLHQHQHHQQQQQRQALPVLTVDVSEPKSAEGKQSVLLAEQAAWLQEELARCSSDEEGLEPPGSSLLPGGGGLDSNECFLTPSSSPMVPGTSDAFDELPGRESAGLLGLGFEPRPIDHAKIAEQCDTVAANTFGNPKSRSVSASKHDSMLPPSMPKRYSSLLRRASSDLFASTQPESSTLFEDSYSPSSSPMADNGHGSHTPLIRSDSGSARAQRRASIAESSDSMHSTSSHASSLLAPASSLISGGLLMERNASVDTNASSRPSSIASSHCDKVLPLRPSRSPRRANLPLPTLPQLESDFGDDASGWGSEGHGSLLSPTDKPRMTTKTGRRRNKERPELPARMTSLDDSVAAAPGQEQLREEFPERLLGDWMVERSPQNGDGIRDGRDREQTISISPLPFATMMRSDSRTVSLPGIGEIIPPSPDTSQEIFGLDIRSPAALKRLGEAQPSVDRLTLSSRAGPSSVSLVHDGSVVPERSETPTGLVRSPSRMGNLRARLTGRLGSSMDLLRATAASPDAEESFAPSAKSSSTINRLMGGRSSRKPREPLEEDSPRLPAAWEDQIGSRRLLDRRSPSQMSGQVGSVPPHHIHMALDLGNPQRQAAMDQAAREAPQSATPSFASEESRTRASSSFWRMLNPSANASLASLGSSLSLNPGRTTHSSEHAAPIAAAMMRQRSAGDSSSSVLLRERYPGAEPGGERTGLRQPSTSINVHRSFVDLSEEDEGPDHGASAHEGQTVKARGSGRKDLSKIFGMSETHLQIGTSTVPRTVETEGVSSSKSAKWKSSLGRSSKKKQQQLLPPQLQ